MSPMLPIMSVNLIGTLGLGIVIPFIVFLNKKFGGNEIMYGFIVSGYSAFQLIGAPLLGKYSDKVGRRKALLISQAGTFLSWIILIYALYAPIETIATFDNTILGSFVLTWPLLLLFLARGFDGFTGGNIAVANAYVTDISTDETRSKNFGKIAATSNVGFVLGPTLAGILGATVYGELIPVLGAAALAFVGLVLIYYYLPESNPKLISEKNKNHHCTKVLALETKGTFDQPVDDITLKNILKLPRMRQMLIIYFLVFVAFSLFYSGFPVHAESTLGWDVSKLGIFYSFLSCVMVIVQGPVMGFLSNKVSPEHLAYTGGMILALSYGMLFSNNPIFIYGSAFCFALGNGIMWPSYLSLLGKIGSTFQKGYIQGLATSVGSFASILGLVSGGLLYSEINQSTFIVGSIFFIAAVIMMVFTFLPNKKSAPNWSA